jgi:hypothetical protein
VFDPMRASRSHATLRSMQASYAVTWQEGAGSVRSGKLELRPSRLVLEGAIGSELHSRVVEYEDLRSVQIVRSPYERLYGLPTLLVGTRSADPLKIAGLSQPGIITELAEGLTSMLDGEPRSSRLALLLPLKEGSRERAKALLERGPPFDPEAVGLERHHVFLTEQEAIFVFEASSIDEVERLGSDPSLWSAAAGWKELVAGPPRLAEDAYSWVRPSSSDEVFFGPTPGPGDSDGGDVYGP